jgi:signal transduction histidine kinase
MGPDRLSTIRAKGGVGLRGMRERVRQFAGAVHIESQEGAGTTILVTLPLARLSERRCRESKIANAL